MCGRIDLHTPAQEIALRFQAVLGFDCDAVAPGWNIAPARKILALLGSDGGRQLVGLTWGFVPRWARDLEGPKPINARSDTIFAKPMFQDAIRHRRCLIPVDGFYEWRRDGRCKQPYYFRMADGHPFALGGIWDTWAGRMAGEEGYTLRSCAILTTAANQLMAPVHDRMPVIVPAENHERWLARDLTRADQIEGLLRPLDSACMVAYAVSSNVNKAANDGPELIESL